MGETGIVVFFVFLTVFFSDEMSLGKGTNCCTRGSRIEAVMGVVVVLVGFDEAKVVGGREDKGDVITDASDVGADNIGEGNRGMGNERGIDEGGTIWGGWIGRYKEKEISGVIMLDLLTAVLRGLGGEGLARADTSVASISEVEDCSAVFWRLGRELRGLGSLGTGSPPQVLSVHLEQV